MASKFARRTLALSLTLALGLSLAPPSNGDDAAKEKHHVYVEVCVAELSISKLRSLGIVFDTSLLASDRDHDDTVDQIAILDSLIKNNLAAILSHPRLATMSGRPASIHVGDVIKLDIAPQVIDSEKIQVEYRIELHQPPRESAAGGDKQPRQPATQLTLSSATELAPGQLYCVSQTRSRRTNERGKAEDVATIVLLRADLKPPADIRTAEKPSPPILPGSYRELPKR